MTILNSLHISFLLATVPVETSRSHSADLFMSWLHPLDSTITNSVGDLISDNDSIRFSRSIPSQHYRSEFGTVCQVKHRTGAKGIDQEIPS